MEANKLNELLNSFNAQADSVKQRLTEMLVTVSDGRAPDKKDVQLFNHDMDALISEFDQIKREAESVLSSDELPNDGSRAKEYVEAVANSKSRIIKIQLERAESVLTRFLKVKSLITEYESALSPFKEKAAGVLNTLSEENIEQMLSEADAPELFLKALDTENINGPDGFQILGEINKYYPMQVQWGLVGRQYYIDETQKTDFQTNETGDQATEQIGDNVVSTPNNEEESETITVSDKEAEELPTVKSSVTDAEEMVSEDESQEDDSVKEEEIVEKTEEKEETLVANNKVKQGSPSASSFKKEITKIASNNEEVRAILPMMTNLGVLTKKQIYLIGICMDCFEESDRDREKVEAAVEILTKKGYLARFEYVYDDINMDVYCLSTYCYLY